MTTRLRVLILEDREADAELMLHELRRAGFDPDWRRVETEADYLAGLEARPELILADYSLPQFDAIEALRHLQERELDIPFIVITGVIGDEAAAECLKRGAADYLLKDRMARLGKAIVHALEEKQLREAQRRSQEALRESEERYRMLFDANPHAMWVYELGSLRFLAVNDAAVRQYGYSPEEFLAMTIKDIRPQEDVPLLLDAIQRLSPGLRQTSVWRHKKKDGTIIDVEITSHGLHFGQRDARLVLAIDVTERKRAEKMIERLRRHNELILNSAGDGIYGVDLQGRTTFVNPAAERMFGWGAEELLGKSIHGIVHHSRPDGSPYPADECQMYAALRDGRHHHIDSEVFWRKDGTRFPIEYVSTPIRDERGELIGAVATFRDISERKQAEEALRQQFARISLLNEITRAIAERQDLRSIFHVAIQHLEDFLAIDLGAIYLFDPESNTLTVAARASKSGLLAAEYGLPEEGAVVPAEQTALRAALKNEMIYMPDTAQASTPISRQLARTGIRSSVIVPLAVESSVFGILAVGRGAVDGFSEGEREFLRQLGNHVSLASHQARLHEHLRKAYDELRQTQQSVRQQERLQALGQMASGMAHDINNAISPIVGFIDVLLMDEPHLSERARRYLQHIRTSGTDIADIVSRMRELYRKRDGREILVPLDLNRVVQQVIDLTRPRWKDIPQERGTVIEVATDLQADLPVMAAVESEVREALANLIFNAVDAMPDGGTLTIRTVVTEQASLRSGRGEAPTRIVLEVGDTGIGMDEETRRRCLEPFFSTKGKHGTGLGLAMVFGVMQRYDGAVQIDSEPGKGTTVRLVFPVFGPEGSGVSLAPEVAAPTRPLRMLYIDDEPLLRELVKDMLEVDGHTVELADGGQKGLDLFREARKRGESFDVVVTDLGMPFLDGRQVAGYIKRDAPATPVILLTGWGSRMLDEGERPPHVDYVLSKPPRLSALRQAVALASRPPKASRGVSGGAE